MNVDNDPRASLRGAEQVHTPAPLPDEPFYRRGDQTRRWGSILLLVGVIWLVFALGSRAPLFGVGFVERTEAISAQTFAAERVVVTGVADRVELVGWSEDGVQVAAVKHAFGWNGAAAAEALEQLEVVLTTQGETLLVEVRRPLGTIVGRAPYAELRIALPAGVSAEARVVSGAIDVAEVQGDLTLSTVSGDLEATDTRGSLTLSTTSGDLEVRDHRGPLVAESVNGDVDLTGALASPTVKTVSGDASLDGATGRVELSSISGDLSVAGDRLDALSVESTSGDIEAAISLTPSAEGRISNISGDVELRLVGLADLALDVSTTSGDISSNLGGLDEERRSLRGTLGAGAARLVVSTTSGDVEVSEE